jgi:hypothetical protein
MLFNGGKFMYPDSIEWLLMVMAYVNLAEEARHMKEAFLIAKPAMARFATTSSLQTEYRTPSL